MLLCWLFVLCFFLNKCIKRTAYEFRDEKYFRLRLFTLVPFYPSDKSKILSYLQIICKLQQISNNYWGIKNYTFVNISKARR